MDPRLVFILVQALSIIKRLFIPLLLIAIITYFVYRNYGDQIVNIKSMPAMLYDKVLNYIGGIGKSVKM
jgi:hypothetical protein